MTSYDVTVLVVTYKPNWNKLQATLLSILKQKEVKIQIVVSDDGSDDNCFIQVEKLFLAHKFTDYCLVANKKNKGIVSNVLSGLRVSKSEYIKPISPGDLLYNELTLKSWVCFIIDNKANITFSKVVFYRKNNIDNFAIIKHKQNPNNIKDFIKPLSRLDRVISYLLLEDGISGAAILVKRKLLESYLLLLEGKVVFAEDFFLRLAIVEGENIKYYPAIGIWYEHGDGGISTTPNPLWQERMRKDAFNIGKICLERYKGNDLRIIDCIKEYCHHHDGAKLSRWEWRGKLLCHPRWLYWYLKRRCFATYAPIKVDVSFLSSCFLESK